jgi:AAA domain
MALLDEILNWSKSLPAWQSDAIRRLFQTEASLTDIDFQQLYSLLKANANLTASDMLVPVPLADTHLPSNPSPSDSLILTSLRDLENVNRIALNQNLKFAASGMTVIYGGNGTGKSGYARVLKSACRARGKHELVLPNANEAPAQNRIPTAVFEVVSGGNAKQLRWSANGQPPKELAAISIFDSRCARAYLNEQQDIAYLPYGLDVVEALANVVFPELNRRLSAEIHATNVDRQPFAHLLGDSSVGRLIQSLSASTKISDLKLLANLSEIEVVEINTIETALAEVDPKRKAQEHKFIAQRFKDLSAKIKGKASWVSAGAIEKLKKLTDDAVTANLAEKFAEDSLSQAEELHDGTGGLVWKSLFEAARKFSSEVAYPQHSFPHVGPSSKCLLCQQDLNEASAARLAQFEAYVQNDIAKAAAEFRQKLSTAKDKIERADLGFGLEKSQISELKLADTEIASTIVNFEQQLAARRKWMIDSLTSLNWANPPALLVSPTLALRKLAAQQLLKTRFYLRAIDELQKQKLLARKSELIARKNLQASLPAVEALIDRLNLHAALVACQKSLGTKPISDKAKEFSSEAVTLALKNALDEEFTALGIGHIKTELKPITGKGKVKHQLLLKLPSAKDIEQILSEGEQRAIALGSFLAELKLSNHHCGIVFDDPVSSLDHRRRKKVSVRLASESKLRQVIVFTHDVVLLHELQDACTRIQLPPHLCYLEPVNGFYGHVAEGLPWAHKSYKERLDFLEKAQKRFEKLPWPTEPSDHLASEIIRSYGFLRATIERVVQDFVLNGTVRRFDDYIRVKNLDRVVGLATSDFVEIERLYQRCHDIVEAHDPASYKDETPPTPHELKKDLDDLKHLIALIEARRNGKPI